jgi:hypothetical protein
MELEHFPYFVLTADILEMSQTEHRLGIYIL